MRDTFYALMHVSIVYNMNYAGGKTRYGFINYQIICNNMEVATYKCVVGIVNKT